MARAVNPYGDGRAADRIAAWLLARLRGGTYPTPFEAPRVVKGLAPLLAAGSTFAVTVVVGLLAGVWLDHRLGTSYWVLVLFFAGFVLGIYGAWRLVSRALSP